MTTDHPRIFHDHTPVFDQDFRAIFGKKSGSIFGMYGDDENMAIFHDFWAEKCVL